MFKKFTKSKNFQKNCGLKMLGGFQNNFKNWNLTYGLWVTWFTYSMCSSDIYSFHIGRCGLKEPLGIWVDFAINILFTAIYSVAGSGGTDDFGFGFGLGFGVHCNGHCVSFINPWMSSETWAFFVFTD